MVSSLSLTLFLSRSPLYRLLQRRLPPLLSLLGHFIYVSSKLTFTLRAHEQPQWQWSFTSLSFSFQMPCACDVYALCAFILEFSLEWEYGHKRVISWLCNVLSLFCHRQFQSLELRNLTKATSFSTCLELKPLSVLKSSPRIYSLADRRRPQMVLHSFAI